MGDDRRPLAAPRSDVPSGALTSIAFALYGALAWLAVLVASPWWLARAAFDARFRALLVERAAVRAPRSSAGSKRRVLLHCVSVGEVKGVSSLVRALAERAPQLELVVSATTDTGLDLARKLYPGATVVRFPFDLGFSIERFLEHVKPSAVILMELELWPNFLRRVERRGIPVAVVNGRINASSARGYRRFASLFAFDRLSLVCAQNDEYAARFVELGVARDRVVATGNLKVDGLRTGPMESSAEFARRVGAGAGRAVLVAGSTHAPEEVLVARAWREAAPSAQLVIAPRHPERVRALESEFAALAIGTQLWSDLRDRRSEPDPARVTLIDTIGELEAIYALADLVYVGGGHSDRGGQNMLEPAARARAVVYGPNVKNFRQEAELLESVGAGRRVEALDLARNFAELLGDPELRRRMGAAGEQVVNAQKGATRATLEALSRLWLGDESRSGLAERGGASMLGVDSL